MKKYIILPALAAALAFGACSNDDQRIFSESAADRLENSKKDNFAALTADGGKWAMEYFANTEEPGYLFVMEFRPDKSVTITTDHKWIGGAEKSEISMFDVITDNGVVLTFNTYNNLFHIFSDPADITGDNAPTNNGSEIDETGYGHEGDYEFMMMENNGQSIRLRGKKYALNAYLRHLPADTDASEYLAVARKLRNQFDSKRFPTYTMTETATGATYDLTGMAAGIVSCLPTTSTNPFAQTETKAVIYTASGMRPISMFNGIRLDNSRFSISEFTWADDGSLVAPGFRITAPLAHATTLRKDLTFNVDMATISEPIQQALDEANAEMQAANNKVFGRNPKISSLTLGYDTNLLTSVVMYGASTKVGSIKYTMFGNIKPIEGTTIKIEFTEEDEAIQMYLSKLAPKAVDFIRMFEGEFDVVNDSPFSPARIHFVKKSDPSVTFSVDVK